VSRWDSPLAAGGSHSCVAVPRFKFPKGFAKVNEIVLDGSRPRGGGQGAGHQYQAACAALWILPK
jgi:hypothetical protein